jgi:hypothetical protein
MPNDVKGEGMRGLSRIRLNARVLIGGIASAIALAAAPAAAQPESFHYRWTENISGTAPQPRTRGDMAYTAELIIDARGFEMTDPERHHVFFSIKAKLCH